MKRRAILLVLALSAGATAAFGHAHLKSTVPAEGSVLTSALASIQLTFGEPVRVTAAWLQNATGARQDLGPLPSASAAQVSVPLPPLAAGSYTVAWRAVSADGHIMPGKLTFQLRATPAVH